MSGNKWRHCYSTGSHGIKAPHRKSVKQNFEKIRYTGNITMIKILQLSIKLKAALLEKIKDANEKSIKVQQEKISFLRCPSRQNFFIKYMK